VSGGIVQAVLNAWEMERHHAAERHLYPEVIEALQAIKSEHPNVIIGAVTDGKANPRLMTFTLAPYFDFCLSWEDDQTGRKKFFQDLTSVEGNVELKWIYDAALEKYQELSSAKSALQKSDATDPTNPLWIHVGDDLAYDVGGAAQSGAKTIWLELDRQKYAQTARFRFDPNSPQPAWSTTTRQELEKRKVMNELALKRVDASIHFISRLPEAIQDILERENAPEAVRATVEEATM
jgi:phosphoglycolate phosphatase-like HAD superfamily hydrolase